MHILAKLFGTEARVRLMRLFLQNPDLVFEQKEAIRRSKLSSRATSQELRLLSSIGFISKRRGNTFDTSTKNVQAKRVMGWGLSSGFPYSKQLHALVVHEEPLSEKDILRHFKNTGRFTLFVISGVFINEDRSRADLLIVGDKLKKGVIERNIKQLEALIGREISYSILDTRDFEYRYSVYDKFVRDILDFPHRKLVNKLDL